MKRFGGNIGIIGAGNMGKAIMGGILKAGLVDAGSMMICDLNQAGLEQLEKEYGIATTTDSLQVMDFSDFIVAALKPNIVLKALSEISQAVSKDKILVSIAAGTSIARLESAVGADKKIVRVMPNTPVMVGEGMSALCCNANVTQEDRQLVQNFFSSFGKCEFVSESLINAVTSVSGSGPAYVFMFIEAMADAAVLSGMPRNMAYTFAGQTVLGAARMVLESGKHPGELKDMVCSPSGTTIEAVRVLEKEGLRNAVMQGQLACYKKALEMSQENAD